MTTTILRAAQPELQGEVFASGYDGRYRLYTHEHIAFDAVPAYRDGGPAKVTPGEWSVSYSSVDRVFSSPDVVEADDRMVTLRSHRENRADVTEWPHMEDHALNGTKYATQRDAERAAFDAGLSAFMVYEKDAHKWGLPTG